MYRSLGGAYKGGYECSEVCMCKVGYGMFKGGYGVFTGGYGVFRCIWVV